MPVLVVVGIRAAVGVLEPIFVFGDGRALVLTSFGDAVAVGVLDLVGEHDAEDPAPRRHTDALQDAGAAAEAEEHRPIERLDLDRAVDLERVRPALRLELGRAEALGEDAEDRAHLITARHAVSKVDRPDRRRAEGRVLPECAGDVQPERERSALAVEDGAELAGERGVVADVAAARGRMPGREDQAAGDAEQVRILRGSEETELALEERVAEPELGEAAGLRQPRRRVDALSAVVLERQPHADLEDLDRRDRGEQVHRHHVLNDMNAGRLPHVGRAAVRLREGNPEHEGVARIVETRLADTNPNRRPSAPVRRSGSSSRRGWRESPDRELALLWTRRSRRAGHEQPRREGEAQAPRVLDHLPSLDRRRGRRAQKPESLPD